MEYFLNLPQMRLSGEQLVARARAAEAAGFAGVVGMDHLAPPGATNQPMFEAMTTSTWLPAHSERLKVGSLVLCDAFRHPAVLAQQVVTIDHLSGGRFELGIGWGSVADEFATFGIGATETPYRVGRLAETLEIVRRLWTGDAVDFDGEHFTLRGARQRPVPRNRIPVTIGGAGPRTLGLVRAYADWWNVPVNQLDLIEQRRDLAGDARVSIQQLVALVPSESERDAVTGAATRRFGGYGSLVIGTAEELAAHFNQVASRGVERVYAWFADFAPVDTLQRFGEVIAARA